MRGSTGARFQSHVDTLKAGSKGQGERQLLKPHAGLLKNGCKRHPDCFECPEEDCVMGYNEMTGWKGRE